MNDELENYDFFAELRKKRVQMSAELQADPEAFFKRLEGVPAAFFKSLGIRNEWVE